MTIARAEIVSKTEPHAPGGPSVFRKPPSISDGGRSLGERGGNTTSLSHRFTDSQIDEFVAYVREEQDSLANQRFTLQQQDDPADVPDAIEGTILCLVRVFALIDGTLSDDAAVLFSCLLEGSTEMTKKRPRQQVCDLIHKEFEKPIMWSEASIVIEQIGQFIEQFADESSVDRARAMYLRIAETVVATDGTVSPAEQAQIDALRNRLSRSERRG